jgi:hypothetical protein
MAKINKAGIQPIPTEYYSITGSEVIKYLQDQLGFSVGYDFTRWTGVSPDASYVRLRIVLNPSDIVAETSSRDYADRMLARNSAGTLFKDTVVEALKPYMYPENFISLRSNPEALDRIMKIGIYGERLDEIERNTRLNYCREANVYRLYLSAEKIITDMLADPSTDKPDGDVGIIGVRGTSSDTIRWDIALTNKKSSFMTKSDVSIDQIFNSL